MKVSTYRSLAWIGTAIQNSYSHYNSVYKKAPKKNKTRHAVCGNIYFIPLFHSTQIFLPFHLSVQSQGHPTMQKKHTATLTRFGTNSHGSDRKPCTPGIKGFKGKASLSSHLILLWCTFSLLDSSKHKSLEPSARFKSLHVCISLQSNSIQSVITRGGDAVSSTNRSLNVDRNAALSLSRAAS